jgi:adenylosuccinate synthase
MKASVVIGANYGDEGKGITTDYLAAREPSAVIRFNSGAQAGHTVVTPDGKRHVFHHFGSGTLARSPTYLSSFFVVNPIVFVQEMAQLLKLGDWFHVSISSECAVTTPYDIMLNQAAERERGSARHGSCGLGFNETIHRNTSWPYRLTFNHLRRPETLERILKLIRNEYVPRRAGELGITKPIPEIENERILEHFMEDCRTLVHNTTYCSYLDFVSDLGDIEHLIFEGAQGLLLDMDRGVFPHVTRSNTGFKNAHELTKRAQIEDVDLYYVSRTYLTRHGAGPLLGETPFPLTMTADSTNVSNEHQGALRYAPLNGEELTYRIARDTVVVQSPYRLRPHFVLTCADQTNDMVGEDTADSFAWSVSKSLAGAKSYLISRGPTRNDIKETHL